MSLPTTFSGVKIDEQGRRYVVHQPSGVIYYVRDDHPTWGTDPRKPGPVTVYSKKAAKKARKEARKMERLVKGDLFTSPPPAPRAAVVGGVEREYFAVFVPVEGV